MPTERSAAQAALMRAADHLTETERISNAGIGQPPFLFPRRRLEGGDASINGAPVEDAFSLYFAALGRVPDVKR